MRKYSQETFSLSFNSRPCVRGDGSVVFSTSSGRWFQFTPLREGRRIPPQRVQRVARFQFTPLREGRRRAIGCCYVYFLVSIHAPA